jgi:hypothetical protein
MCIPEGLFIFCKNKSDSFVHKIAMISATKLQTLSHHNKAAFGQCMLWSGCLGNFTVVAINNLTKIKDAVFFM